MSIEKVKQTSKEASVPEKPCLCDEPCDHAEQLQEATINYLEHDVFHNHPIASGGGIAILVSAVFGFIRYLKRGK